MENARTTPNPRSGARGISEQDVWEAADTLLMAGHRPTIERIRQQLGRGSPNTVSPYLDAWFAGLGARLKGGGALAGVPEGIDMPEPIARAALDLWGAALQAARDAVAVEAAARSAALDARQTELDEAREALEQARAVLHERVAAAEVAAADARQARDEAQAQARRAEALLITAQGEAVESRRVTGEAQLANAALREDHAAQRAGWDEERSRLNARAEANEKRLMIELDGAREALKAAQQDQKQLKRQVQDAEAANAALAEAQRTADAARATQESVIGRLREQVAAQEALAANYQALLAAAQREQSVALAGPAGSPARRIRPLAPAGMAAASGLRRGRRA